MRWGVRRGEERLGEVCGVMGKYREGSKKKRGKAC